MPAVCLQLVSGSRRAPLHGCCYRYTLLLLSEFNAFAIDVDGEWEGRPGQERPANPLPRHATPPAVLYAVRDDFDNPWKGLTKAAAHEQALKDWKVRAAHMCLRWPPTIAVGCTWCRTPVD